MVKIQVAFLEFGHLAILHFGGKSGLEGLSSYLPSLGPHFVLKVKSDYCILIGLAFSSNQNESRKVQQAFR